MNITIIIFTLWFELSGSVIGSIVLPYYFNTIDKTINIMKKEIWKDVPNYEGIYQVSNLGKVKSLERTSWMAMNECCRTHKEKFLKPDNTSEYLRLILFKDDVKRRYSIHQLVAMAFLNHKIGHEGLVINHKNFIKVDNRVENLEIVTIRENSNKKHLISTSKFVGVSYQKKDKKWRARITYNGKTIYLGFFNKEEEASLYYDNALVAIEKGENIIVKRKIGNNN